jgi:RHS repeat-associated protein
MGGISYAYNGDGNRIQQDALRYILDLQPGLAQVIGDSDGNRYIHSPRGIHAFQSPTSTWSYIMQDGLGSVRSVADSDGSIVSTHNYTPIGVMDVPFEWGFTGEQRDYTGVQYHRARYYSPELGIFPSLDPFEGGVQRPMSLNGYSWVEGRVINAVDPTGYALTRGQVESGEAQYSCNCGWIDWGHTDQRFNSIELLRNLQYAANNPGNFWGFRYRSGVTLGGTWLELFNDIAIIPDNEIKQRYNSNPESIEALAISILMDGSETFEQNQAFLEQFIPGPDSGWSEEDLVSNLLGFYIGKREVFNNLDFETQIKPEVKQLCGAFENRQDSLDVWDYTYAGGENVRYGIGSSGWRSWYPRLLSLVDCSGNIDLSESTAGQCNRHARGWPNVFAQITNKRIHPQIYGTWWWASEVNYSPKDISAVSGQLNLYRLERFHIAEPVPEP